MKTCTNEYKENIKKFGREIDSIITYELNSEDIELGNQQLNSVTPHYESNILKSVMKQLDIDSNTDIPLGTEVNYQFGVKVRNEEVQDYKDNYDYINYGNYIVYKSEKQEDTNSYRLLCYDKMLYAMVDYETPKVSGTAITYPITIRNYINAICSHLGLTFENASDTFVNYDKQIASELYLDSNGKGLGYTFRDVLDELAEVTASTICINDEDKLEIRYIEKEETPELPDIDRSIGWNYVEIKNNGSSVYTDLKQMNGNYTHEFSYSGDNDSITLDYWGQYSLWINDYNTLFYPMSENLAQLISSSNITVKWSDQTGWYDRSYYFDEYSIEYVSNLYNNYPGIAVTVKKNISGVQPYIDSQYQHLIITATYNTSANLQNSVIEKKYGYLRGQYETYAVAEGTEITLTNNTSTTPVSLELKGNTYQEQTPSPSNPKNIKVATGLQTITVTSGNNTQSFNVNLGSYELCDLGSNYQDKIYKKNGNWYISKNTNKTTFTGANSETWYAYGDNQTTVRGFYIFVDSEVENVGLSNYFTKYDGDLGYGGSVQINYEAISICDVLIKITINKTTANSVSDFKTWLSTHNLIVYNALESATETQITDSTLISQLEAIRLYVGNNNVVITPSSNNNLSAIMRITYKGNEEDEIEIDEDSLKNINVSFGEKYGPVNTIVLSRSAGTDKIALSEPSNLSDDDKIAIEIADNQIMNGNNRDTFISGILNQLYGLEYYLNDFNSIGITYLDLCDKYNVKIGNNTYNCIMFNDEVDITQGLEEKIYTEKPEDSVNDYKNISETDRQLQQTTLEVDKQNSRIKAVAKTISLTTSDSGNSAGIVIKAYNEDGTEISSTSGTITLSGKVSFTDLSTSNPSTTVINGSNITTGTIKSNNYSANVSGTSIDLSNGVIDSKDFKVNSTGQMTASAGFIGTWQIFGDYLQSTDSNGNIIRISNNYLGYVDAISGNTYNVDWVTLINSVRNN